MRLFKVILIILASAVMVACGGGGNDDSPSPVAKAAWTSSATSLLTDYSIFGVAPPVLQTFDNQTVRQIVSVAVSGSKLRIKLSNVLGGVDVTISKASIGKIQTAQSIVEGSTVAVSFGGASGVTIAAGKEIWSDPVNIETAAASKLAVDVYFQTPTPVTTGHLYTNSAFIASGDQTGAATLSGSASASSSYLLTEIDTYSRNIKKVVVAFGDSITQGQTSKVGGYPYFLQDRFNQSSQVGSVSVVNAGISGNRILRDFTGPSALSRFGRDDLGVTGVTDTIVFMGINDIQNDAVFPDQKANADQIISGLVTMVNQAKQAGVKITLGTILPWGGSVYYSSDREAVRKAVNAWIRSNKLADAVVDFDLALRNPQSALVLDPAYDSGDHVHPNDAGYQKMATTLDLNAI